MVVGPATTGSRSMATSAARMSRSRASWVIITTGTGLVLLGARLLQHGDERDAVLAQDARHLREHARTVRAITRR